MTDLEARCNIPIGKLEMAHYILHWQIVQIMVG
jgi:hypothetical protein